MTDFFATQATSRTTPAFDLTPVTPNDGADLPQYAKAIYVGTGGSLRLETLAGTTVTLVDLAGGIVHPIGAKRILATGTTAQNLVAVTQ